VSQRAENIFPVGVGLAVDEQKRYLFSGGGAKDEGKKEQHLGGAVRGKIKALSRKRERTPIR